MGPDVTAKQSCICFIVSKFIKTSPPLMKGLLMHVNRKKIKIKPTISPQEKCVMMVFYPCCPLLCKSPVMSLWWFVYLNPLKGLHFLLLVFWQRSPIKHSHGNWIRKLWYLEVTLANLKINVPVNTEGKFPKQDLIHCFAQYNSFYYCLGC